LRHQDTEFQYLEQYPRSFFFKNLFHPTGY